MNFEMTDKRGGRDILNWRKKLLLALIIWFSVALQVSFLSYLPIFGAVIEVVAVVILLIAWRYGALTGMWLGLLGGVLLDALSATGISLLPLLFPLMALVSFVLSCRLHDHALTFCLTVAVGCVPLAVLRCIQLQSAWNLLTTPLLAVFAAAVVYWVGRGKR